MPMYQASGYSQSFVILVRTRNGSTLFTLRKPLIS
jgi:hypothetical protein